MTRLPLQATLAAALIVSQVVGARAQPYPFAQDPFTDVPRSHPHFAAIEYLRENNVLRGYLDGNFRPARRITRAEFIVLMTNPFLLHGERKNTCLEENFTDEDTTVFFRDVRIDSDEAEAVCIGFTEHLIHGYPDGIFRPRRPISFVEGAKIASTVLALQERKDRAVDERWYTVYVRNLADLHAIPRTIRRFGQPLTRGEMAEIVYRLKLPGDRESARFEEFQT